MSQDVVYKGMTPKELDDAYNVFNSISDPLGWLEANRKRAAEVTERLKPVKDVSYGPEPLQKLDIYAPSGVKDAPVIIEIHGGGWVSGSKEPRSICAEPLMKEGILWVPIDYGLAPNYSIHDIIDHTRKAIGWVHEHIAAYGGSPEKLYVFGNSAGGHLAATTLMPGWEKADCIKGAICLSGVYDMRAMFYADGDIQKALKMSLEDAKATSPLLHLPARKVPVVIAYGEKEPPVYHYESTTYANALKDIGLDTTLIEVPEANHFSIINELAHTDGQLYRAVLDLLQR